MASLHTIETSLKKIASKCPSTAGIPTPEQISKGKPLSNNEYARIVYEYSRLNRRQAAITFVDNVPYLPMTNKKGQYILYKPPSSEEKDEIWDIYMQCLEYGLDEDSDGELDCDNKGEKKPMKYKPPKPEDLEAAKISKDVRQEIFKDGYTLLGYDMAGCQTCDTGVFIPCSEFAEGRILGSHSTTAKHVSCKKPAGRWGYPSTMKLVELPSDSQRMAKVYKLWKNLADYYPLLNSSDYLSGFLSTFPWSSEEDYYHKKAHFLHKTFLIEALTGPNTDEPLGQDLWKKYTGEDSTDDSSEDERPKKKTAGKTKPERTREPPKEEKEKESKEKPAEKKGATKEPQNQTQKEFQKLFKEF